MTTQPHLNQPGDLLEIAMDEYTATRRVIVRAAAALGESRP